MLTSCHMDRHNHVDTGGSHSTCVPHSGNSVSDYSNMAVRYISRPSPRTYDCMQVGGVGTGTLGYSSYPTDFGFMPSATYIRNVFNSSNSSFLAPPPPPNGTSTGGPLMDVPGGYCSGGISTKENANNQTLHPAYMGGHTGTHNSSIPGTMKNDYYAALQDVNTYGGRIPASPGSTPSSRGGSPNNDEYCNTENEKGECYFIFYLKIDPSLYFFLFVIKQASKQQLWLSTDIFGGVCGDSRKFSAAFPLF